MHPAPKLVFYSLRADASMKSGAVATFQLLKSIRSLRKYNRDMPVHVYLFGQITTAERSALLGLNATIVERDAEELLRTHCSSAVAEVLARSPVIHYALCLDILNVPSETRVLYLDSDTYLFNDVATIFDKYAVDDVYAREEPYSRNSHLGYDSRLVDEDAVAVLAEQLGIRSVAPFNKGAVLFNHGSWVRIARRLPYLFDLIFRFSLGVLATGNRAGGEITYLERHAHRLFTEDERARRLLPPTENVWIRDQIALWLTLGATGSCSVGSFSRYDVCQSNEYRRVSLWTQTLAHYFSGNMSDFESWLEERLPRRTLRRTSKKDPVGYLASRIEDSWQREDYDDAAFSLLASAALREVDPEDLRSAMPLIGEIDGAPPDLQRTRAALVLFRGTRFRIEVVWRQNNMGSIRRRGRSGASLILAGAVLDTRYSFRTRRRVSSRFLLGDLSYTDAAICERGAIVEVAADTISRVQALSPLAILRITSDRDAEAGTVYEYRYPSIAFDAIHRQRSTELVGRIMLEEPEKRVSALAEVVVRSDLQTAWEIAGEYCRVTNDLSEVGQILHVARARHGEHAEVLAQEIEESARKRRASRLRNETTDGGQALLLLLLATVPCRQPIDIAASWFNRAITPQAQILEWLDDLSGVNRIGVDLGDELTREAVRGLIQGRTGETLLELLGEHFGAERIAAEREAVTAHCRALTYTILAPLFRES